MTVGPYISGAGHTAFVAFLIFGGLFQRDHLPEMSVADVSVISSAEFAALSSNTPAPEIETDTPTPVQPESQPAPDVPADEAPPERSEPDVTEPPEEAEDIPDQPDPIPTPPAQVTDDAPVIAPPATEDTLAALTPDAAPAPAPRVAPEAAPAPPLEAETAPDVAPEVAAEPDAPPAEVEEESEATAPEEATTEIVTEAEERPNNAPVASMRPRARPQRPVQQSETETPQVAQPDQDALAAALNEASSENTSSAPSGPPLTGGEKDAFRIAIERCWVVDVGSEAANVTVVAAFSLTPDGKVVGNQIRQLSASGGSDAAIRAAFESARRAILRCQSTGYDLPADKYEQWRDVEITFNPEGMRLR